MSEPTPIAGTLNVTEDPDTVVGQLSLRSNFAFNHLLIATNAAREAHAIERQNAGAPFGPWFDRMMQLVPVSIVMAGAALDASVHELIQDILDGLTSIVPNESRTKLLADLLADRSGNPTQKFRRLGLLLDKDPDTGTERWRNIKLLVRFRNEFMHFRPAWDDDEIHGGEFVEELKKKVKLVEAYKGKSLFPYVFMTYDCARWAARTVLQFSAYYSKEIDVKDRFALPGMDLRLP